MSGLLDTLPQPFDRTGWYTHRQIRERTGWSDGATRRYAEEKVSSGEWETTHQVVSGRWTRLYRLKEQ